MVGCGTSPSRARSPAGTPHKRLRLPEAQRAGLGPIDKSRVSKYLESRGLIYYVCIKLFASELDIVAAVHTLLAEHVPRSGMTLLFQRGLSTA